MLGVPLGLQQSRDVTDANECSKIAARALQRSFGRAKLLDGSAPRFGLELAASKTLACIYIYICIDTNILSAFSASGRG